MLDPHDQSLDASRCVRRRLDADAHAEDHGQPVEEAFETTLAKEVCPSDVEIAGASAADEERPIAQEASPGAPREHQGADRPTLTEQLRSCAQSLVSTWSLRN